MVPIVTITSHQALLRSEGNNVLNGNIVCYKSKERIFILSVSHSNIGVLFFLSGFDIWQIRELTVKLEHFIIQDQTKCHLLCTR